MAKTKIKNIATVFAIIAAVTTLAILYRQRPPHTIQQPAAPKPSQTALNSACDGQPTPSLTSGPYYKEGSPQRKNVAEDTTGQKLTLTGSVLTTQCQPIAGAKLDFWQTDGLGQYDNQGYRLRGHQFSDSQGRYQLDTILPGPYPGRTPHIHVKIDAPNDMVLVTQLFLPNQAKNQQDAIFNPKLIINISKSENGLRANFDFVIPIS